jgi:hypothetical protein
MQSAFLPIWVPTALGEHLGDRLHIQRVGGDLEDRQDWGHGDLQPFEAVDDGNEPVAGWP